MKTASKFSIIVLKFFMEKVSKIANNYDDEKVQELVDYLQPLRFVTQNTDLDKVYNDLKNDYAKEDAKKYLLQWECFENSDTRSLKFWDFSALEDKVLDSGLDGNICFEILKLKKPLTNCETFGIKLVIWPEIFGDESQKYSRLFPLQDVAKIFTYLPNLKTISWLGAVEEQLNHKVFTDIFPKYFQLKKLVTILYDHASVENFCVFVEKSSKQLESLILRISNHVEFSKICKMFGTLPSLLKLKRMDLCYHHLLSITKNQITSLPTQTSEITIKELHLSNPKLEQF